MLEIVEPLAFSQTSLSLWVFATSVLVASFVGLVARRLPHQLGWREHPEENLTIWSSARCGSCEHKLGMIDLIPILGWLLRCGRCAYCRVAIPYEFPLTELGTGLLGVGAVLVFGWSWELLAFLGLLWVSLLLSWVDITDQWLPAAVTTPLLWAGLLLSPFEPEVQSRVIGAAVGGGLFWAAFVITGWIKKMDVYSGGDVAMISVAGAWLGIMALCDLIFFTAAFFAVYAVPARLKGELGAPMGPALCASLLVVAVLRHLEVGLVLPVAF